MLLFIKDSPTCLYNNIIRRLAFSSNFTVQPIPRLLCVCVCVLKTVFAFKIYIYKKNQMDTTWTVTLSLLLTALIAVYRYICNKQRYFQTIGMPHLKPTFLFGHQLPLLLKKNQFPGSREATLRQNAR